MGEELILDVDRVDGGALVDDPAHVQPPPELVAAPRELHQVPSADPLPPVVVVVELHQVPGAGPLLTARHLHSKRPCVRPELDPELRVNTLQSSDDKKKT